MFKKRNKKVLVIGGKGFIGSHLMKADFGEMQVSCLDIKDGPLGDVKSEAWQENDYDFIVMLACNQAQTQKAYTDNMQMLASLEKYLDFHPQTHTVYASSAAVYPDEYKSMNEDDDAMFSAPTIYGDGKLMGEMVFFHRRASILRLGNVHGKGGKGVIDLFKAGEQTIYGTGMQVRDFISVEEVVATIVAAVNNPRQWRGTFNVSTGHGQTVLHQYKKFGKGSPIFIKARPNDVKFSVLDNARWLDQWK